MGTWLSWSLVVMEPGCHGAWVSWEPGWHGAWVLWSPGCQGTWVLWSEGVNQGVKEPGCHQELVHPVV